MLQEEMGEEEKGEEKSIKLESIFKYGKTNLAYLLNELLSQKSEQHLVFQHHYLLDSLAERWPGAVRKLNYVQTST